MGKSILKELGISRSDVISNKLSEEEVYNILKNAIAQASSIYKIEVGDFFSKARQRPIVMARQSVFFLLRYKYGIGPKITANIFLKKFNFSMNHATISYACDAFFDNIETDFLTALSYKKLHSLSDIYHLSIKDSFVPKLIPQSCDLTEGDCLLLSRLKLELTDKLSKAVIQKKVLEREIDVVDINIYLLNEDLKKASDNPKKFIELYKSEQYGA